MRKLSYLLLLVVGLTTFAACNHQETYADQKDREREVINKYLRDSSVTVISEADFAARGYKTDVSKNEYVLFGSTGVYMQIVREGVGDKVKDGETLNLLCRFTERNMMTDTIEVSNILGIMLGRSYSTVLNSYDKISVSNNSGTFTGTFDGNHSVLIYSHRLNTTSVPKGWLVPLTFIKVGRPANEGDEIAKVRLIVPHDMGHTNATAAVTPYLYDITYQRER